MPSPPQTTPLPFPFIQPAMSPAAPGQMPSDSSSSDAGVDTPETTNSTTSKLEKDLEVGFPRPKLRLEVRDLRHPGARCFLDAVEAFEAMDSGVRKVLRLLYDTPDCPVTHAPPTRSVTLILRDMGGVAYTTGSELDGDHKELHFSLRYISGIPEDRCADEITGVLVHELVHCLQYNGHNTCNGGLIEGVADWVRLRCGLGPPHWRRNLDGRWDAGYSATAYFLDYLEGRFGDGTVRRLNEKLRTGKYDEKAFWTELVGRPVDQLWCDYCDEARGGS